jgi:hypothetical protein
VHTKECVVRRGPGPSRVEPASSLRGGSARVLGVRRSIRSFRTQQRAWANSTSLSSFPPPKRLY